MSAQIFAHLEGQDPRPGSGTCARLQWKGTKVCMDFHCNCGNTMHLDCRFLYFVMCSGCGADYALSPYVRVVEIPRGMSTELYQDSRYWTEDEQGNTVNA